MQRKTTTQQLQSAIKNNILILEKSEIYNKTTRETEVILNDKFLESFDFFYESVFFMDAVGWHFERDYKTGIYEIDACRLDGDADIVIIAYFRKNNGVSDEVVNDVLLKVEEE